MSLTVTDLQEIRRIIKEEISPMNDELQALRNDIKEIYDMIFELQNSSITDKKFQQLSLKQKLLAINAELISAAKQAGITLPR